MVGDDTKLPLFHGNGTDDPKKYYFLGEVVWNVKQTTDDDVKKGELVTTLWGACTGLVHEIYTNSYGDPCKKIG